ncbi:MAG: nuclear transport factor 2 family protein [bacterium]
MITPNRNAVRIEIEQALKNINSAWSKGRFEELEKYIHKDFIIAQPGFQHRGVGRETCIQSYRDFVSNATIHDFKESDFTIDIWGETAVASYRFEMDWEMNDKHFQESGHDLYVFIQKNNQWQAVWRTLTPQISKEE